jgi:hypothetical protein
MKKTDIKLIGVIFIICLLILGIYKTIPKETNKRYVVIKVEREIVKRIEIDDRTQGTYKFDFNSNEGEIEVKNGAVRMKKMSKAICPREICSKTGWIEKNYETIVCMPNKIIVSIEKM